MCWNIEIMEGTKVVREIATTDEAIAFFGRNNVRFDDGSIPSVLERHDYCLCPVDVEALAERAGYCLLDHTDPRWSPMDHRFEKATS